jgi:glycosyltransferase involved in cell wall biosynthesis
VPSVSIADALSLVRAQVTAQVRATTLIQPSAIVRADPAPRDRITLVVPCCNEELSIAYLANTLARFETGAAASYTVHYVFVDDGSTDETHTKLRQHFGQNPRAQIVRHETNKGVAAATMTGLLHAPTELVGVIDCDCSYDPAEVVRMIPLMQSGTALVTASPYHPDGHVVNVPAWRLWLSRRLSQLYRVTLNTPLYTYTACVRLYRKSALQDLTLRHGNYLGIAEILARLDQSGARIVESPATLEARILGHSKMKIVRTSIGHIGLLSELLMARILLRTKKQLGFAHE